MLASSVQLKNKIGEAVINYKKKHNQEITEDRGDAVCILRMILCCFFLVLGGLVSVILVIHVRD